MLVIFEHEESQLIFMKNPHDTSEYTPLGAESNSKKPEAIASEPVAGDTPAEQTEQPRPKKQKRHKFSGAYYYVDCDEKKLAEKSFICTLLIISAFFLQIIILFLPAQTSLEYITNNLASYALLYVVGVFVNIIVSVWLIVMSMTRYKFRKRIPVEYAPKKGFARRAFFGNELYIAANALLTIMQISFVCIMYDPITLVAVFISAAATAAAVVARQVTHLALKNAELIPAAPDPEN